MQPFNTKIGNFRRPEPKGQIVTVGRVEDVPPGRGATVELLDGTELALFNVNGEFYATENFCPHKGAPLADGRLCQYMLECDWHGWRFDVRSGQCLNASGGVRTFKVIIEDGMIKIAI